MPNINIDLHITIKDIIKKTTLYIKNFTMFVRAEFIIGTEGKKHNIENHLEWLKTKIRINQQKEVSQQKTKWSVYYINYGINIGSEINGTRPSIIFKDSEYGFGSDIIIIPMTSFDLDKSIDTFDIEIEPTKSNGLKRKSLIKTRQMRCISQKRIEKYIGKIEDRDIMDQLDKNITTMLGLQSKKNPSDCSEGHAQSR